MLQVLGESKRSQGRSALYADACQQIADAIRVRCNQLSVLCGRLATTGLGETSEHATCFAALSAYTWLDGRLAGLERECFAANSQARFETDYVKHHQEVHAEVLDALSRHLPRPSQHCAAYATLRKSPRVAPVSRTRWDVGCATHRRCAGASTSGVRSD